MTRKIIAIILSFSLAACGGGDPEDDTPPDTGSRPPACEKNPQSCL